MTPKEAFRKLCMNNSIGIYDTDDEDELKTIETALNRLEELEKVLEIIKEKKVDIDILISSDVLITYNDFNHYGIDLTETEFNLLKEYLK